jgi:hypothetical protein
MKLKSKKFKLPQVARALKELFKTPSMPPRLVFARVCGSLAIRARPAINPRRIVQIAARRAFADKKAPDSSPNQNVLGHVSEEAAGISRTIGETQPEPSQGTPVQDVRLSLCAGNWNFGWLRIHEIGKKIY